MELKGKKFVFNKEKYSLNNAINTLSNIYSDREITTIGETDFEWELSVNVAISENWYVDPKINLLGNIKGITDYHIFKKQNGKYILSANYHSYAILAAIRYENENNPKISKVIHFDDHSDMMPFYTHTDSDNFNLKTNNPEKLIKENIIGIGNFLTYFVSNFKCESISHIQSPLSSLYFNETKIKYINKTKGYIGNNTYIKHLVSENLGHKAFLYERITLENLKVGNDEIIWLDIDFDYFCNRYNRDSEWERYDYLNRSAKEIAKEFIDFTNSIIQTMWFKHVVVLTFAYSPGFFPVEFYNLAKSLVEDPLKEALVNGR